MMNITQLKNVQQNVAAQGGKHLGTLLWWSLSDNHIERSQLESLAQQHGLNTKYLPSPIKPTTAFRRAWRHANTNNGEGVMLRQIAEDENCIVIGVVQETPDAVQLELDYSTLAKMQFNKITDSLYIEGQHPTARRVQDLFKHHQSHTTEDIRAMLTNFVQLGGLALREMGGVYFIPSHYQATMEALVAVVHTVGRNIVYQLPLYDAPQVRDTLTDVAKSSLDDEIRALQEELNRFDDKTRQSTMERRLAKFEELRSRVGLFSGVLSFKADELENKLECAHRDLRIKLGLESPLAKQKQNIPVEIVSTWTPEKAIGF